MHSSYDDAVDDVARPVSFLHKLKKFYKSIQRTSQRQNSITSKRHRQNSNGVPMLHYRVVVDLNDDMEKRLVEDVSSVLTTSSISKSSQLEASTFHSRQDQRYAKATRRGEGLSS
jgi:hypothetical protein